MLIGVGATSSLSNAQAPLAQRCWEELRGGGQQMSATLSEWRAAPGSVSVENRNGSIKVKRC
jgi:hypothetical protein